LGLPILQGYGMTECCITCVNRINNNVPTSVGHVLPNVEVKLGENNALLIHGPSVMLGYWNNPDATRSVLTQDGWLNSGDMAHIDEEGRITITGRLKEIIVMSNGEKIPPVDMETAIMRDPLFEQVMLIGEGRSYLSVLVVFNSNSWASVSAQHDLDPELRHLIQDDKVEKIVIDRIAHQIREFPGYAKIHRAALVPEPWTVENGMLTSTLKLRRAQVLDRYKDEVNRLYEGH
jgi:long-chain acyl-CoA synthetase